VVVERDEDGARFPNLSKLLFDLVPLVERPDCPENLLSQTFDTPKLILGSAEYLFGASESAVEGLGADVADAVYEIESDLVFRIFFH